MATSDLNSVVLIGRLTRDAELTYMQNGNAVCSMGIAVNRSRKDGDQWVSEVNYFDVSYFGKPAEAVKQYLTKGKQIAVQGSLRQDRWEKDGQKFSKVRIVANSVELLGGRSDGASSGYNGTGYAGGYQKQASYSANPSAQMNNSNYNSMPPEPSPYGETFGGDSGDFPEDVPF